MVLDMIFRISKLNQSEIYRVLSQSLMEYDTKIDDMSLYGRRLIMRARKNFVYIWNVFENIEYT